MLWWLSEYIDLTWAAYLRHIDSERHFSNFTSLNRNTTTFLWRRKIRRLTVLLFRKTYTPEQEVSFILLYILFLSLLPNKRKAASSFLTRKLPLSLFPYQDASFYLSSHIRHFFNLFFFLRFLPCDSKVSFCLEANVLIFFLSVSLLPPSLIPNKEATKTTTIRHSVFIKKIKPF